ncbi:MAG: methyltransferase domain-containing protein [Planctomycetota bacterium]
MSQIYSIQQPIKSGDIKEEFKVRAWQCLAATFPKKARRLYRHPNCFPEAYQDKWLMAFLKRKATTRNSNQFFDRLHRRFWEGEGGSVFDTNCRHRFYDLFLRKQQQDLNEVRKYWDRIRPNRIVEFGCNSGLVLNYLTQVLPGVKSSTGVEINSEQVVRNQGSPDFDSRVEFVCSDATQWLYANAKSNCMFVSNGGVLEYFSAEKLTKMFQFIRQKLSPSMFLCIEPVAQDHDFEKSENSIRFGEELSFSHNYHHLFKSCGFHVVYQRAFHFDRWKLMTTIATA